MTPPLPKGQWTVWGGLVLVVLTIVVLFILAKLNRLSPAPPPFGKVSDFNLTNQLGHPITLASLRGQIWVADIIFTRCGGPCPVMTKSMSDLQSALPATSPVKFISLTTDPEFDTPIVLKRYGERFGAEASRWWFLTGTKGEIGRLATEGLKLTALEKDASSRDDANDLFIHATLFVVVDQAGQLRAAVEGLEPGAREQILQVIEALRREKETTMLSSLPAVNATLNFLSAVFLSAGYYFIRQKRMIPHRNCMLSAFVTSTIFLVSYVIYHVNVGRTVFKEPQWFRPIYLGLLLTHTILAVAIVPMVLITLSRALRERFESHKAIARWTWPIWMYVSVTGVLIYFLLYQIYPQR